MVRQPKWNDGEPIATFALFAWTSPKKYIEPNGLMTDELLVVLPGLSERFLRIDGYIESGKVAWLARAVLEPQSAEVQKHIGQKKGTI
jgi:hypothetical protein